MFVQAIQPKNEALAFIDKRLLDDGYRGSTSSQHNRYDMAEIFETLSLLDKYAPNQGLMRIRDSDMKKRPQNLPEETAYAEFTESVNAKVGKGTQDSIRKNIFVDLHRMGLINRYDGKSEALDPYGKSSVKYVAISAEGLKLLKANLLDRAFVFTKAIDRLLGGYVEVSLGLLKDAEKELLRITKYEFMFFVSAIDADKSFGISRAECEKLIKSFRFLARTQQKAVIETLKQKLKPELFLGDKTQQRDWHNWQNKIDQIFHLFHQTPYFDVSGPDKEILTLSTRKVQTKAGAILDLPKRSLAEKFRYFEQHKVDKTPGYELHHVLPLSWSESAEQYKLFDKWLNMVYIDAFSHAKITQNKNRNVVMTADGDGINLSDFHDNQVSLSKNKTLLYSVSHQQKMLDYNFELRTTVPSS
jgi:hypothetical protein